MIPSKPRPGLYATRPTVRTLSLDQPRNAGLHGVRELPQDVAVTATGARPWGERPRTTGTKRSGTYCCWTCDGMEPIPGVGTRSTNGTAALTKYPTATGAWGKGKRKGEYGRLRTGRPEGPGKPSSPVPRGTNTSAHHRLTGHSSTHSPNRPPT